MGINEGTIKTEPAINDESSHEQFFKEMGLDTCYAQDFAVSPLLSEIVILEKTIRFQENKTTHSTINEKSRAKLIHELSIKKNILMRILYKLEEEFALKKRLTLKNGIGLSMQDRQERAAFVRHVSNQTILKMLQSNILDLESVLNNPPKGFTEDDDEVGRTAIKLIVELMQLFN